MTTATQDTAQQRSPEWFAQRQGRVTASIVGGLLDCAPYMSKDAAFRILVRSMHGLPSEFSGNIATEWGNANEDLARAAYEIETGNNVLESGFVAWENWAGSSPDGLVGNDGLVEIKCPFGIRKDASPVFKSAEEQPHYYGQMQFQMFCTGRDWYDFWQWTPNGSRIERVARNEAWIDENVPTLLAIWQDARQADPAEYEGALRAVFDTPETDRLTSEWDELAEAIENATVRRKEIIARLAEISGGKDAEISGRKFTLVRRKGSVSYAKALADIAPDADLEPYRGKASESWKLT